MDRISRTPILPKQTNSLYNYSEVLCPLASLVTGRELFWCAPNKAVRHSAFRDGPGRPHRDPSPDPVRRGLLAGLHHYLMSCDSLQSGSQCEAHLIFSFSTIPPFLSFPSPHVCTTFSSYPPSITFPFLSIATAKGYDTPSSKKNTYLTLFVLSFCIRINKKNKEYFVAFVINAGHTFTSHTRLCYRSFSCQK